ncbi:hypothetical protein ACFLV0_03725 [Chloroflexota bacterium]
MPCYETRIFQFLTEHNDFEAMKIEALYRDFSVVVLARIGEQLVEGDILNLALATAGENTNYQTKDYQCGEFLNE